MGTLGDRLRAARLGKGLTQDDLAERLDVTKSSISGWENNRDQPSTEKLPRLRAELGVSLDVLICGDYPAHAPERPSAGVAESMGARYAAPELTREQQRLLTHFERLTEKQRRALLQLLAG